MRVLHLHSGNLFGGVETFLVTLAREAFRAPRMRTEFALCFEGRLGRELAAHGDAPYMLGLVRLSRPDLLLRARRRLSAHLSRHRPDAVVCHQAWPYAIFARTLRRAGVPIVFWLHTAGDGRHWLERWARGVTPDLAVATSQFAAGHLSTWFPGARVEWVYPPLTAPAVRISDSVSRGAMRRSLDTASTDVVFVQVGRLEALKGNRTTIDALARLKDLEGWTYWLVGGPQRPSDERLLRELEALARDRGIGGRVRFLGERNDVGDLLRAADIYCQPNLAPEAFGISLVEALWAGLPIVTSAIGGAHEIVDESCGILAPPGDVARVADAMRRLFTDRDLRATLAAAAPERAERLCDASRQLGRVEGLLSSVAHAELAAT